MFLIKNIENKLKKSIFKTNANKNTFIIVTNVTNTKINKLLQLNNNFIFKYLINYFLSFISKILINKKYITKLFISFLKINKNLNYYFLKNNNLFFKKYFFKKNFELLDLENFFLNTTVIPLNHTLDKIKKKRIDFFKKFVWSKNKKFRKKNLLIFNKKFFRFYTFNRINSFIVESLLPLFKFYNNNNKKPQRILKYFTVLKKKFYDIFFKRYHYLFLLKHYTFKKTRKKFIKNIFNFDFFTLTNPRFITHKRIYIKKKREIWRKGYKKGRKKYFVSMKLMNLNIFLLNKIALKRIRKKKLKIRRKINLFKSILKTYLKNYAKKLSIKKWRNKNFFKFFFKKRNFYKRFRNIIYFFKRKPRVFLFQNFSQFKKVKNLKKISYSIFLFKLFSKKIYWKRRKFFKKFFLFFFNKFFFNKLKIFFHEKFLLNCFFFNRKRWTKIFKIKKRFLNLNKKSKKKIIQKKYIYKKRNFKYYQKKKFKDRIKVSFKLIFRIKILKNFLLLLFLNFFNKEKNLSKNLIFKNAFVFKKLNIIKLQMLSLILSDYNSFYFKKNLLFLNDFYINKNDTKFISLLKKN